MFRARFAAAVIGMPDHASPMTVDNETMRRLFSLPTPNPREVPVLMDTLHKQNRRRIDEIVCFESRPAEARASLRKGVS